MSWLTQVHLGKDEAAKLRIRDTYAWHQRLWRAFSTSDEPGRPFLFRLDDQHDLFRVLMLSSSAPVAQGWGSWKLKRVAHSFLGHDHYLFQIRANPTVKRVVRDVAGERIKNGRRTAIYDEQGLREWIERKAVQSGFELLECTNDPPIPYYFVRLFKDLLYWSNRVKVQWAQEYWSTLADEGQDESTGQPSGEEHGS